MVVFICIALFLLLLFYSAPLVLLVWAISSVMHACGYHPAQDERRAHPEQHFIFREPAPETYLAPKKKSGTD